MDQISHRSFVSYIDKSRDFYAAQGYEQPYRWVSQGDIAFTALTKPLSEVRVGVVTTSYFHEGTEPDGVPPARPKKAYAAPTGAVTGPMFTADLSWAKDETHTDDLGSYLPLAHLEALAANGIIGSVSPRFYGVPTSYSSRRTANQDGPRIAAWMHEDQVDIALLVPL